MARHKITSSFMAALKPPASGRLEIFDQLLPAFGLRISFTGQVSWFVFFRMRGRLLRLTLGDYPKYGPAEARDRARRALEEVDVGRDPRPLMRPTRDFSGQEAQTVAVVAEDFIRRYASQRRWREFERALRHDVLPVIGQHLIRAVTRADLVRLLDGIVDRGAPVQANRVLVVLRRFMDWSTKRGIIDASPAAAIDKPTVEKHRDRVLSDAEIAAFWRTADAMGYPFGRIAQLLLLTGARREEIGAARWVEIHHVQRLLTVDAARFKSARPLVIPLAPMAMAIVNDLPRVEGSPFLFSTTRERAVSGWSKAKSKFDALMLADLQRQSAEANLTPWTIHDLRRTTRTRLSALGVSPDIAERVLGHAIGGVRGRYDHHAYIDEKRRALEQWAVALGVIISPPTGELLLAS